MRWKTLAFLSLVYVDLTLGHEHFGGKCVHGHGDEDAFTLATDFSLGQEVMGKVDPPPLEISPLFVSGPIQNRVDLVFFSDGCTFPSKLDFCTLTTNRPFVREGEVLGGRPCVSY